MRPTDRNMVVGRQIFKRARCGAAFVLSALFVVVMCATTALAQFTTARLSGTVMDNTSSAIAGATVTVEQTGTGYRQTAKTGASGDFVFPSLPVGNYQLTVEMTGFTTYVQKGIGLTVGQAASQKVTMQCGCCNPAGHGAGECKPGNHRRCADRAGDQ